MKDIDFECWFCGKGFDRPLVEEDSLLVPRVRRDGGPFLLYTCPHCKRKSRVERNRAGAFLAGPIPIVPFVEAVMATFDADLKRDLLHKKEFLKRREGRRTWFFEVYERELLEAGVRPGRFQRAAEPEDEAEPQPKAERKAPQGESQAEPEGRKVEPEGAQEIEREPPEPPPTPWEILGLEPGADPQMISSAFKELAKRYHPDRFEALDGEFKALAHRKFVQLKAAHDELLET